MWRSWKMALSGLAILFVALCFIPKLEASICTPGDKAEVRWKGRWYAATVLRSKGNSCYIHYDGYNSSWDEWVGPERIQILGARPVAFFPHQYHVGDAVSVHWGGKWWPAHVLRTKGNKLYIKYDGYGDKWNEWVGPNRYQAP